eukprot:8443552-Pyramimonas_sp.AAC.1
MGSMRVGPTGGKRRQSHRAGARLENFFLIDRRALALATPPIISDCGLTKCAICLEEFVYHHEMWRLQCGHLFHAQCWDPVVHARVERQPEGAPSEAPCAIC